MNSVERVKNLCKERRIPISRLEKELGFANGYISQLRKGVFPSDRLVEIAVYLGVSVDYLANGTEETQKAPTPESERETDLSPAFFRLKQGLEPYDLSESDADFLLKVYKAQIKKNQ